jgi:hypothetical protein
MRAGRSSRSNVSGRSESVRTDQFRDGRGDHEPDENRADTMLTADPTKTVL